MTIYQNNIFGIENKIWIFKPSPAVHVCKTFAHNLEQDQTPSNSSSGQVPSCLPLGQYLFQILSKLIKTLMRSRRQFKADGIFAAGEGLKLPPKSN